MAKPGRPPEAVPQDKADAIIEWISSGKTLRDWCRQEGNPSFRAVYDWVNKDDEFASRFARARDVGHDVIAEDCMAIIDEFPIMAESESGSRIDSAHVSWMKNRVEMRLKLLAKWNPKKYGDKIDLTSDGKQVGLNIMIDLGEPK